MSSTAAKKSEEKRENAKNFPSAHEVSNYKFTGNPLPLPKANSNIQHVKSPSKKINERNAVQKNQFFQSQHSSKTLVKNCTASKVAKVKSFKKNQPSDKTHKVISPRLFRKVTVKNSVKEETKKTKLLADKNFGSNASLPICNEDLQIEGNKNKEYVPFENILEKENEKQLVKDDFSAQKSIKFEGNEIFRQMILRGRDLSPSVCRLAPGVKLSSVISRRPSAYDTVVEVHPDPHQYALQAIERMSVKRGNRKLTLPTERMPMSPFRVRNSFYTPVVDPEKEVMKKLEAIRAKRMQKSALKSSQKKVTFNFNIEDIDAKVDLPPEQKPVANSEVRNSIYTPRVYPEKEFMKKLEAISSKQMQKSALKSSQKKVTFIEDINAKVDLPPEQKLVAKSQEKLTEINEASSENTPSSPVRNPIDTDSEEEENHLKLFKLENLNGQNKSTEQGYGGHARLESDEDSEINSLVGKYLNVLRPSETNNLFIADSNKSPFCSSKKMSSIFLNRNGNSKLTNEAFNCKKTIPQILPICIDQCKQRTTGMKLCTPRPISFSSNSRVLLNCSPDFLENRNMANLSNLAPIYTPLVLKNIAKHSAESPENLSPVKLKLDFTAAECDTPKKEISEKMQVSSVKKIVTATKMLDNLADKECDVFLSNQNCPVVCGRYLRNPVALTLTEGDEMHFLPIRL